MTSRTRWGKPILRWAGSKRGLVAVLASCVPSRYGTYLEPFVGSACLFFAVRPSRAVLGDFNEQLIATYDTVRRHPRLVARRLTPWAPTSDQYYAIRALDPAALSEIDRAARFIYLNRHCFNGVYRTNRNGQFNVPLGTRVGQVPSEGDFYRCSMALRSASLVADDFCTTLRGARRGDFAYLDPPYSTSTRPSYGEYGYGAFAKADERRLLDELSALDQRGVSVLFSYSDDGDVVDALDGWSVVAFDIRRQIAGTADRRASTREILASNTVDVAAMVAGAPMSVSNPRMCSA